VLVRHRRNDQHHGAHTHAIFDHSELHWDSMLVRFFGLTPQRQRAVP
jgi:hypothetical protein